MMRNIKTLLKMQIINTLNINVIRFTKDKSQRKKFVAMLFIWLFIAVMMAFYVATISSVLISMNLGSVLPSYFVAMTSLVILFFTMLKTGSIIFQKDSYDTLCSLPLNPNSIVISRFLRMYIGNLMLSLLVMVPGLGVYAFMVRPSAVFYVYGIFGTLFLPMLPMTIATLLGALITAVSSRMKHKSIFSALFSIILLIGILLLNSQTVKFEDFDSQQTTEMFTEFSKTITAYLSKIYPPAIWLGDSITGSNATKGLIFFAFSMVIFALAMIIISKNFNSISRKLNSTYAKHNYKMEELKAGSALSSLYKRELKRYFNCSIYVVNTIVGPIIAVIACVALLIMGVDSIKGYIPLQINYGDVVPIVIAAFTCMMTPTSCSISLEGHQWWITKSLPIKTKAIIDSKLLAYISVFSPFCLISVILMLIALKPSFSSAIWIIIFPGISLIFSNVFGLVVNLKMPKFDWSNETVVVKQSSAVFFGQFGGLIIMLICAFPIVFLTMIPSYIIKACVIALLCGATALLYSTAVKTDLQQLG